MSVAVDSKDVVRARIDKNLKKEAHEILATLGLTVSDFIRIALTKVVNERGLPFDMYVPNAETLETFEKTNRGGDVVYAEDMDDLFKKLDI
ncbi:type II toxin-antitoxin system RelB/DinJ family antitoxin [Bartonella refiksaydamii]|uniref:type II toxin-antitoxin system RelB/DinJ family antitoxin n=1 Tax=Bartonella refiksaydamii TaxID=2654951 RepID=UPI0012EB079E|nr:type II toxin-antitoxin system RelB/DinJ family antitoxin [Bartonella refiksaydamii]